MNYGEKISHLRKSNGMTQEELGKVLNVTFQAVSKWERGESLPDFNTMSQMAKFFQVPLSYFEEGGENIETASHAESVTAAFETNKVVGICGECGKILVDDEVYTYTPKIICKDCAERFKAEEKNKKAETNNIIGICSECGKLLVEDEVFTRTPKIICKDCAERLKEEEENKKASEQIRRRNVIEKSVQEQIGGGIDVKLIICLILSLAAYVALTVVTFLNDSDREMIAAFLMLVPLAVFACPYVIFDFIDDWRDKDDDTEGYNCLLSLIVGGAFAIVNLILFLVIYLTIDQNGYYLALLGTGTVVSFTFISQYMWGSCVKDIFTCGGFTFKLPGVIFSLTPESIIMMILIKILLGIVAVLVFIVTTILFAVVAIFGSVFTFIPCIISKIAKDRKARQELV